MSRSKNRLNGGILGKQITTTGTSASGIWNINGIRNKILETQWPRVTQPWDVANLSYAKTSSSMTGGLTRGLFFKSDGTKIYRLNAISNNLSIYEYNLPTPYDFGTVSLSATKSLSAFYTPSNENGTRGLYVKPDGKNWYFGNFYELNDVCDVHQWNTATGWDINGLNYVGKVSIISRETVIQDLFFSSDGTKMYTLGDRDNAVDQWSLSTAWNVTTATWSTGKVLTGESITFPRGLFFKPDGTKMYVTAARVTPTAARLVEYDLSSPWAVNTASFSQSAVTESTEIPAVNGNGIALLNLNADGTKAFGVSSINNGGIGVPNNTLYQFQL